MVSKLIRCPNANIKVVESLLQLLLKVMEFRNVKKIVQKHPGVICELLDNLKLLSTQNFFSQDLSSHNSKPNSKSSV